MPGTSDAPIEIEPGPARQGGLLTFDEDGDLRLMVGTNPSQEMLVDSHVLCRTSPVFRKMLRGPFAERKPRQGNWNIKLPEDDSGSFVVLMDMAHGLFCLAREETTVGRLYGLCVLTDKYDMVSVLRPMQGRWFKKIEASINSFALHNILHRKMMFIAFELGYSAPLKGWILSLMQKCPTDMNGDFIDKNDVLLMHYRTFTTPHMSNILKHAAELRQKFLAHYKTSCRDFTTRALNGSPLRAPPTCSSSYSCRWNRDTPASIGIMLNEAHKLNITDFFLPLAAEPDVTMSLSSLRLKLVEVEITTQAKCGCGFMWKLMGDLQKFECEVLTTEDETYMRGQAAKVRML